MSVARHIVEAELTWVDGALRPGVRVGVAEDGTIAAVGALPNLPTRTLPRRALLPGFVNAHSHAFQRALRGSGETYPAGMGDFWSWREAMYALVERLTPAELKQITRAAFDEMRRAGITTVGEFHYVHHADSEALDFALDEIILEAAREAGIRLVLLACFYKTGGVGKPLAGGQRRFATPDVGAFLQQVDRLAGKLDPRAQSLGIAPHSLRAVPTDDLKLLHREARARRMVCHVHVEEQPKEIEEFQAAAGCTPLRWILDNLEIGPEFTIVHATHSTPDMLTEYVARGGNICVCPLTEGNLGDGLARIVDVPGAAARVCLGSDSNVRIDMLEEVRWLEFAQRLRLQRRGAYKSDGAEVAGRLLDCATQHGAHSLNIETGEIAQGKMADLIAVDLDHAALRGLDEAALPSAIVLGASAAIVRETCVGGLWR